MARPRVVRPVRRLVVVGQVGVGLVAAGPDGREDVGEGPVAHARRVDPRPAEVDVQVGDEEVAQVRPLVEVGPALQAPGDAPVARERREEEGVPQGVARRPAPDVDPRQVTVPERAPDGGPGEGGRAVVGLEDDPRHRAGSGVLPDAPHVEAEADGRRRGRVDEDDTVPRAASAPALRAPSRLPATPGTPESQGAGTASEPPSDRGHQG